MPNHYCHKDTHFYREQTLRVTGSLNGVMSPNKRCNFCGRRCNKDVKKVKGTGTSAANPAIRYCPDEACVARGKAFEKELQEVFKQNGLLTKRKRGNK